MEKEESIKESSSNSSKKDIIEEISKNKDVSVVSNVSNVSNVKTDIKDKKDNGQDIVQAYSGKLLSRIMQLLRDRQNLSYKEIGDILETSKDTITKTMLRDIENFEEAGRIINVISWKLSKIGLKKLEENEDVRKTIENLFSKRKEVIDNSLRLKKEDEQLSQDILRAIKPDFEEKIIYVSFEAILEENPNFGEKLLNDPQTFIKLLQDASESVFDKRYIIRMKNLPKSCQHNIQDLRVEHLGKLITISARSMYLSQARTITECIRFECPNCGSIISIDQNEDTIREPSRCPCGWKGEFKVLSEDKQNLAHVILEDLQENTDNPNTQRVKALLKGDLTELHKIAIFTPGNEIKATGILKEVPIYIRGRISRQSTMIFEVNHAEMFEPEVDIEKFKPEDIKKIEEVASEVDSLGLSVINTSFAPSVFGYEAIKNAIIFQLCGRRNNHKMNEVRNKMNVLLIGDPGLSKSILGKFAIEITPGGRRASGGGSSAVGITASLIKEEDGNYAVAPGAMVLAKEEFFLDELNNLSDEDKPKLQEGMSEQVVSVDKASLHVKLPVTTGILAAANPIHGIFRKNESYMSQFNIPPAILNRFDVIFMMRDVANTEKDTEIAKRMLQRQRNDIQPRFSKEFLRKFFVYVRNFKDPQISPRIERRIQEIYTKLRGDVTSDLTINPRFMEALIRLTIASAKLRLSSHVEVRDIMRSLEILNHSHFQTAEYKNFNFEELKEEIKSE